MMRPTKPSHLYEEIKEDALLHQWILQRAGDASLANDKRAEAFIALASKDWDCSFRITELPTNKITAVRDNKAHVRYQMPKEQVEFERANKCAKLGLERINTAVTLAPQNETAWAYKANILLELSKLAEMTGEVQQRRELIRQYEEALNETTKFAKQRSQSTP